VSELRFESISMPGARLGPANPFPPLQRPDQEAGLAHHAPTGGGMQGGILPYRLQDDYDRQLEQRAFQAAVIENEHLRATFLTQLGGRLWSLYDKFAGRELLRVNPIFQPANLGSRNAWFSGGVEWNMGVWGHSPLTASPLHAARTAADDGQCVLRMYAFERIRRACYQIDAMLPDGSRFLLVRVTIANPNGCDVPMYWWSNVAVPEAPGVRVLAPADTCRSFDYVARGLKEMSLPFHGGQELSYPTNFPAPSDLYFSVPRQSRPWITALDASGAGLIQTSTSLLKGRKLFKWGMGGRGRNWQGRLSLPGYPYIEIQAGLAGTQREFVAMPAGARWQWLEAYGLMEADPAAVHGGNWRAAREEVARRLDAALPAGELEHALSASDAMAGRPPVEVVQPGLGWGALEARRRASAGEPWPVGESMPFVHESLGEDQVPWLALLESSQMPYSPPDRPPGAYMVQAEWRRMLGESVGSGGGAHWLSRLHLGVMHYAAGDRRGAREAWEQSAASEVSVWALRNLAALAVIEGRKAEAADLYRRAFGMRDDLRPLAVECCRAMLAAGLAGELLTMMDRMPPGLATHGRIRGLKATALLAVGDCDAAERILLDGLDVADLREGEGTFQELWTEIQAAKLARRQGSPVTGSLRQEAGRLFPPPPWIDY